MDRKPCQEPKEKNSKWNKGSLWYYQGEESHSFSLLFLMHVCVCVCVSLHWLWLRSQTMFALEIKVKPERRVINPKYSLQRRQDNLKHWLR